MPVNHRFPVLAWEDHQGGWTARVVDREEPAGYGKTLNAALDQLREYLTWLFEHNPYEDAPDFEEPTLRVFTVEVRPEYLVKERRYPEDRALALKVHAVRGQQEHGLMVCSLPLLGPRFYFHESDDLELLVRHTVQQSLSGKSPDVLSRLLPPRSVTLESVNVAARYRPRNRGQDEDRNARTLLGIAEHLGNRYLRQQFSRPYQRDADVAALVRRLSEDGANVLLVGEPSCGKSTVLVDAVRQMERKEEGARYWQTSAGRIISGMKYLGQWELRCEQLVAELGITGGVLCIDHLLGLVQLGGDTPTASLAAFFLPYLQRGEMRMVAEASPAELDACRRLLPGLVDVFQVQVIAEMTREQAVSVLQSQAGQLQSNLHVESGAGIVELVYHLFRRFLPYGAFPGRASRFLADVFEQARQMRRKEVDTGLILARFIRQTGLPELFLRDEMALQLDEARAWFRERIIGQEEACTAMASLVTTFKAGLNDPARPIGVMMLCGPTGVGKTEIAKALSRYLFGSGEDADRMLRLDMSEYAGYGAGERLITRPDGRPSELIQRVREQPFVVVLLDEIEKAAPEVFDVLMGVFDEGRLTDRFGRMTTFRSAVILMTSNLGAGKTSTFGFGPGAPVAYDREALAFFRPEFFNRIDQVVTFGPLGPETIRAITRKELRELAAREGLTRLGLRLEWTEEVEDYLARVGFDAALGARPLQRAIEQEVVAPLARLLLEHPDASGVLRVGVTEGRIEARIAE